MSDLKSLIHKKGGRITPQRQMVLEAVRECGSHCTPEEIYDRVSARATAVNRTTVYRNLEFLVDIGLVTVAHVRGNRTVYEAAGPHPHHHLICQRCDAVMHMEHAPVAEFFARIAQEQRFEVKTDHLVLFGVCAECHSAETSALV